MTVIKFKNVSFTYPEAEKPTVMDISFEIEQGSFVAILGHNGCGKSTLAKLMNGILLPDGGKVTVCGMDTSDESKIIDIRRNVGLVFQNPDNQIVANVVEDDVAFAPENLGIPSAEIRRRVDEALRLTGMYDLREHAPHLLSGGQKQRVAIAGALAMAPGILVLDEPTAMLDPQGRKDVIATVSSLCREKGMTVILITHHMEECIAADRLLVMADGRIVDSGTPAEVFSNVEQMDSVGLSVPETTRILYDLGKTMPGLPVSALSVAACADALAGALKRRV